MQSLLGPQYDAEIAYRQERARAEFGSARRERTGLRGLISRDRRPGSRERLGRTAH